MFVLLLRKEEKKASLLQSYNLITASGYSIRQKPLFFYCFSSMRKKLPQSSLLSKTIFFCSWCLQDSKSYWLLRTSDSSSLLLTSSIVSLSLEKTTYYMCRFLKPFHTKLCTCSVLIFFSITSSSGKEQNTPTAPDNTVNRSFQIVAPLYYWCFSAEKPMRSVQYKNTSYSISWLLLLNFINYKFIVKKLEPTEN